MQPTSALVASGMTTFETCFRTEEIKMARVGLSSEAELLEKQIIETLRAGYDRPESVSDWQGCVRALMRMFDVKRRAIALDLEEL